MKNPTSRREYVLKITTLLLTGALALTTSLASAATLSDMTLTPNSGSNSTTFFDADNDFSETFAFGSNIVAGSVIDSFRLTLDVSGATNESGLFLGFIPVKEDWNIRVQGSASGSADDYFDDITGDGLISFVIDATTDGGGVDAFATSVNSGVFTFWLSENSADSFVANPSITITSARLEVLGTAPTPVPVPASALLLLAGVGGLAAMRKRSST
ncbi:VPLPA-CTERM protein sorting domain-containing protein [Roseobacter denitrificans OCh 114]|nr:VPLPA-CTERM sorting domain-containing protein [Roseobacter denitrificans]SFG17389.1 VPLPA-CTERM protein sorting domain-containing protein [Roseobacter denitrificans OCh 114]